MPGKPAPDPMSATDLPAKEVVKAGGQGIEEMLFDDFGLFRNRSEIHLFVPFREQFRVAMEFGFEVRI